MEPLQLSEQPPLGHVTWQTAWLVHDTLPLLPAVMVHVELSQSMLPLSPVVRTQALPPLQLALHEPAQVPVHWLALSHLKLQLEPPWSQPLPAQLQFAPALH